MVIGSSTVKLKQGTGKVKKLISVPVKIHSADGRQKVEAKDDGASRDSVSSGALQSTGLLQMVEDSPNK
jgi:hypothetical protein